MLHVPNSKDSFWAISFIDSTSQGAAEASVIPNLDKSELSM